jgi:hypothetical protein
MDVDFDPASLSCRSVLFDLLDLRRDIVLCRLKIELRLDIHPEWLPGWRDSAPPSRDGN